MLIFYREEIVFLELHVVAVSHFQTSFPRDFLSKGKRRGNRRQTTKTCEESGTRVRKLYFRSKRPVSGPTREREMADLRKFYCETNRKWFGLSRGKLSFLPAGFFVGLRPPTNIHSRLTLLFTVCGYLFSFLSLIGIFSGCAFCRCSILSLSPRSDHDNHQWISVAPTLSDNEFSQISTVAITKNFLTIPYFKIIL